jgi:hypothetical protein
MNSDILPELIQPSPLVRSVSILFINSFILRAIVKSVGLFSHATPKMILVANFISEAYYHNADCKPSNHLYPTISVQPANENTQLKRNDLRKYHYSHSDQEMDHLGSKHLHKISLAVTSTGCDGSWG